MSEVENVEETVAEAVPEVLPQLEKLESMSPAQVLEVRVTALMHPEERKKVDRHVAEIDAASDPLRHGTLQWLIGNNEKAIKALAGSRDGKLAGYVYAKALDESRRVADARKTLDEMAPSADDVEAKTLQLDCIAKLRDFETLENEVASLEKAWKDRGEYFYFKGILAENDGEYEEAEDLYEKALSLSPDNTNAMFRLAYRFDMRGEDEMAMEFYERCTRAHPPHVNAFMNLGVMYEDTGKYDEAIACFKRVVQYDPTHARARLFLKDAEASKTMYYDEDEEKKEDRLNQILRIPVTDFELSVRSRNCLEKMNLRTLGDLIKMTEAELLAFKNFGETSLAEIKEILASKGLRLGMAREFEADASTSESQSSRTRTESQSGDVESRPISDLELSVRSRRAMAVLSIHTIGDLTRLSEDDLKGVKNFGATSLNEIKKKLEELGLSLGS